MTPGQALIELRTHPRKWLADHYLNAYAGVPATFGVQQMDFGNTGYVDVGGYLGPAGGNVLDRTSGSAKKIGPWTGKGTRSFTFCRTGGQAAFVGAVVQVAVMNIPAVHSTTLHGVYAGLPLNDLSTGAGCDFAVTTLLNGCSYIVDGANPHVMHIQPVGGMTSGTLRTNLHANYPGVFGGGGNEYDHTAEDVTIIGVRSGNGWKIYAQVHTRNQKNIRNVIKLHG